MWNNFIKWRQENDVDNIEKMDISPMKQVEAIFPHNYYCVDKEGRPVYIEQYKYFDLKDITSVRDA